jgi:hypothetical protein
VRFASQARLHILLEPLIQHVVKIEVGQQGADYLPLTDSRLAPQEPSFIDDSDVDPFAYQSQDTPIFDPPLNHLHEFPSHNGVEISGDVGLQHPPRRPQANYPSDLVERVLLALPGAKPV